MSEENYNHYCKVCDGCGEDGCCSAVNCRQSKDGAYCESYLNDLKFGDLMYKDMWDLIDSDEGKKKLDEAFQKNWDLIYKH